jgi:RNA polymerase sigma factor (sigma-70 family)
MKGPELLDEDEELLGEERRTSEDHCRLVAAIAENRSSLKRIVRAHRLSKEDAEDVLQEVFLIALTKLPTIRSCSGFLLAVTARKCIQRKRRNAQVKRECLLPEEFWKKREALGFPEVDLDSKIEIEKLDRLLEELPQTQRNVIRMWLCGSRPEEIAVSLGISPESIRKIRGRGIEKLRSLIRSGGEE